MMAYDAQHQSSMDNFDKLPKILRQILTSMVMNIIITDCLLRDMRASTDLWVDILLQQKEMDDEEEQERLAEAA